MLQFSSNTTTSSIFRQRTSHIEGVFEHYSKLLLFICEIYLFAYVERKIKTCRVPYVNIYIWLLKNNSIIVSEYFFNKGILKSFRSYYYIKDIKPRLQGYNKQSGNNYCTREKMHIGFRFYRDHVTYAFSLNMHS